MRYFYKAMAASLAALMPVAAAHAQAVEGPNCKGTQAPTPSLAGATSYVYNRVGNRELRLQVFPANATRSVPRPAIVFFFGGGFIAGDVAVYAKLARDYAQKGYVAILPDYRAYCRDRTSPAAAVDDGKAALRWIRAHHRELGVDRRRLILAGSSAGGFIAASVGQGDHGNPPIAALVLLNPALDLTFRGWTPHLDPAAARRIAPLSMSFRRLPPTIAFHGDADAVVPIQQPRHHCAAARAAGRTCELVEYAGRGHTLNFDTSILPGQSITVADDMFTRSLRFLDITMAAAQQRR